MLAGVAALVGRASGIDVEDDAAPAMEHAGGGGEERRGDRPVRHCGRLHPPPGRRPPAGGEAERVGLTLERDGEPFTDLDAGHGEPPLHLVLVRRDLSGYVHLHPARAGTGFAVDVALPTPGVWRAYADFEVDGEKIVLGHDLFVPGEFTPTSLPEPAPVVDGGRLPDPAGSRPTT